MDTTGWLRAWGRVLTSVAFLVGALGLWIVSGSVLRMLSAVAILLFAACAIAFVVGRGHRPFVLAGIVLVCLLASPIEVSLANRPGPPGVVPLVMGYPGRDLR